MPVIATSPKYLSEVLGGTFEFSDKLGVAYCYGMVDVEGTAEVEVFGTPLVWNNANASFEVYIDQDIATIAAAGNSPLPNAVPICVSVGGSPGLGFTDGQKVQLEAATPKKFTVLHRGPAAVKEVGIEFGAATAPNITEFMAQLEAQGITSMPTATAIVPSYVV